MPDRATDPAEAGTSIPQGASPPAPPAEPSGAPPPLASLRSSGAASSPASATARRAPRGGIAAAIRKRWRAWLRAVHRDIGYLAVGFTVIYALSGIAMNHIDDWDPNFHATEITRKITPIDAGLSDAEATRRIAEAALIMGICLHDHIVISRAGWSSFRRLGLLDTLPPIRPE